MAFYKALEACQVRNKNEKTKDKLAAILGDYL